MMRYDEYVGGIRSVGTLEFVRRKIGRGEPIHVQDMVSCPDAVKNVGSLRKPRMLVGKYVPDEEHAHICLNCKKKNCTGSCSLVSRTTTGKKRKAKEG